MNAGTKARLITLVKKYCTILAIGFAYLFYCMFIGHGIPCIFNKLTGLLCPGCGITRMCVAIARFDFKAAFGYNQFLFITGPFILAFLVCYDVKYTMYGTVPSKKWNAVAIVFLIMAIIFGILRNIPF